MSGLGSKVVGQKEYAISIGPLQEPFIKCCQDFCFSEIIEMIGYEISSNDRKYPFSGPTFSKVLEQTTQPFADCSQYYPLHELS